MNNEALAVKIDNVALTVEEIKKDIRGNGHTGLLDRMKEMEVAFVGHVKDYNDRVEEMNKMVAERKAIEKKLKDETDQELKDRRKARDGAAWDIKKILITVAVTGTIGVGVNYLMLELLIKPLLQP